tara:strand:- start:106 stop:408 length:303 start_codon:yes stop_codon:yes gene_type:complete
MVITCEMDEISEISDVVSNAIANYNDYIAYTARNDKNQLQELHESYSQLERENCSLQSELKTTRQLLEENDKELYRLKQDQAKTYKELCMYKNVNKTTVK